jgi:ABC-type antimicrobial peptide transport system, ATPase component
MTVFDNVAFAMRVTGASTKAIRKKVPYVLAHVGLAEKSKCFPNELSGGEQQRVSIARALAKKPKLLLCDEPTGALDYVTGKKILQLLQDMCRKEKMTVVLITHNTALTPMADRVIYMKNNRVEKTVLNPYPIPIEEIEW